MEDETELDFDVFPETTNLSPDDTPTVKPDPSAGPILPNTTAAGDNSSVATAANSDSSSVKTASNMAADSSEDSLGTGSHQLGKVEKEDEDVKKASSQVGTRYCTVSTGSRVAFFFLKISWLFEGWFLTLRWTVLLSLSITS